MSKRAEIVLFVVIATVCGFAFYHIAEQTIVPKINYGSDGPNAVQVTPSGWLALLTTALGAGGFSLASVFAIARNAAAFIPASSPFKAWAKPAIDASQIALYMQAYKGAKTQSERDAIRSAAKLADTSLFEELFPEDAATAGPTKLGY